ncbi:MAG: hypothetical protein AB7W47_17260 [Calditrichaceae bacterium]
MDLLNLKIIPKKYNEELIEAVIKKEIESANSIVKNGIDDTESLNRILASFYILGARMIDNQSVTPQGVIYADALIDLVKTVFKDDNPTPVLKKAIRYFSSFDYMENDVSKMRFRDGEFPQAVVVKDLALAIYEGNYDDAIRTSRNILYAIDSKKYFNENLIEIASGYYSEAGHQALILANATSKGLEFLEWDNSEDLVFNVIRYLVNLRNDTSGEWIEPVQADKINYPDYFLRVSVNPGKKGENAVYLTHARQAYRYASAKYQIIWGNLAAYIARSFNDFPTPDNRKTENVSGSIEGIGKAISDKDETSATAQFAGLNKTGENENKLFKPLVLSVCEKGADQDPAGLIFLNSARRMARALKYPRNIHIVQNAVNYAVKLYL